MKDIHRTERIWTSTGYTCPLLRWKRNGASENFLFERCALPTPCCLSSCLNCVMSWSESIYHMHKHAYMLFDLYLLLGVILEVTLVKKKRVPPYSPLPLIAAVHWIISALHLWLCSLLTLAMAFVKRPSSVPIVVEDKLENGNIQVSKPMKFKVTVTW